MPGEEPTLPDLLCLDIPTRVGANYDKFGILLLNDIKGNRVRAFTKQHQQDAEDVMLRILGDWLEGKGLKPVSWETLVTTLRDTGLSALADEIQQKLSTSNS